MSNKSLNDHIRILRKLLANLEKANNEAHPLPRKKNNNNGNAYPLPFAHNFPHKIPTRRQMLKLEINKSRAPTRAELLKQIALANNKSNAKSKPKKRTLLNKILGRHK